MDGSSLSLSLSLFRSLRDVSIKIIDCPENSREILVSAARARLFDRSRTARGREGERQETALPPRLPEEITWMTLAAECIRVGERGRARGDAINDARNPSQDRVTCYSSVLIVIMIASGEVGDAGSSQQRFLPLAQA